jgi:transcription factor SPN1
MALYMHKSETPEMKKVLKGMIETWSRPIFQKSGNLHDLEGAQAARGRGGGDSSSLAGLARARHVEQKREEEERARRAGSGSSGKGSPSAAAAAASSSSSSSSSGRGRTEDDLERIIASGGDGSARDIGNNRVRIPFSKGFQYSVRPESRRGNVSDSRNLVSGRKAAGGGGGVGGAVADERMAALAKRMDAKSKKVNKATIRSANISIEGRVVK